MMPHTIVKLTTMPKLIGTHFVTFFVTVPGTTFYLWALIIVPRKLALGFNLVWKHLFHQNDTRLGLTRRHGFHQIALLPLHIETTSFTYTAEMKLLENKQIFTEARNNCKRVLQAAKNRYAELTKERITTQKLVNLQQRLQQRKIYCFTPTTRGERSNNCIRKSRVAGK